MKSLEQHINEAKKVNFVIYKGEIYEVESNTKALAKALQDSNKLKKEFNSISDEFEDILREQENNPGIELSGGKIADSYGDRLNKINIKKESIIKKLKILSEVPSKIYTKTGKKAMVKDYDFYPVLKSIN